MHVLMGTLALVAGCSTAQRAEVSGVVRDRATGRVIAGARVVGTDGSLAETDADGRFHLYVHGALADVNVSARGHSPEHVAIEGLEAVVALTPVEEMWIDESAHVVGFVEETWLIDGGVGDGSTTSACAQTSLAQAHSAIVGCDALTTSSCATCHGEEARAVASGDAIGAHEGLGGGCLACHGEPSGGDASASCARCHGATASTRTAELGRFFAMATSAVAQGTTFETTSTFDVSTDTISAGAVRSADPGTPVEIATWARALARDRSRGAHDPGAARPPH